MMFNDAELARFLSIQKTGLFGLGQCVLATLPYVITDYR